MAADFLNNPQRDTRVAPLGEGRSQPSCGWMLPRCLLVQTLLSKSDPLNRGANASNGGKGGGWGISKSDRHENAKMLENFANRRC